MPNFSPINLTQVTASIEILPKMEYEIVIGAPKAFNRQAGDDKHDSFGLRYPLTIAEPSEHAGKKGHSNSIYFQNEGGQSMAKQFVMAALGYGKGRQEEERFNRETADADWSFDPDEDNTTIGEIWQRLEGKRIIGFADVQKNKNTGDEMQNWKGWRSITSGAINAGR